MYHRLFLEQLQGVRKGWVATKTVRPLASSTGSEVHEMAEPLTAAGLESLEEAWPVPVAESRKWYERALRVEPGGVQGEGRFYEPHPLFMQKADKARIWDVDGNEYLDYHASFGPAVLGYNHPKVKEAVLSVLDEHGPLFATPHPLEVQLAERIVEMVPSAEKTGFVCSGTEATYHAIRIARASTGREKILKFEGHYHGWHDYVTWSMRFDPDRVGGPASDPEPVPGSAGMLAAVRESVVVREWNDFDGLESAFRSYGEELACLIVEPVCHGSGVIPPENGFLERARELCTEWGVVLIFDEVITGFRHAPGGVQELLKITPDLTAMGKAVANGFPLSLVTGRKDLVGTLSPEGATFFSGTFNGQIINVAAALACTAVLQDEPVHAHLDGLGTRLREGVHEHIDQLGVKAQIKQFGSIWCLYLTDRPIRRFRDIAEFAKDKAHPLQRAYQRWMLGNGIYIQPMYALRAFISAAHTEEDINRTVAATGAFLREHREELS
jgi:glutamate-1-semialdehyde 2,1-aminomutase